jgi:S-formylglutathione hydrolase FrmB
MNTGSVHIGWFQSECLTNNPLNDPSLRKIAVYLPPGYSESAEIRYPVIYLLSGFMGFGTMFLSPQAWGYSLDERCDKLITEGRMTPCILVMPDCFTKYGGSQYLNSSALGNYEDYVIKEVIPHIDRHYRTIDDPQHRAVMGKSSGGYGALMLAMKYPEIFSVCYCSAGDMYFEYCYKPDIPKCYNAIQRSGGLHEFFSKFFDSPKKNGEQITAMNIIAMAAAYSPNPDSRPYGFDLPFDTVTGALNDAVWNRWLERDPVQCIDRSDYQYNLRKLKQLFLDCGFRDEYQLHIGARIFSRKIKALNIPHSLEEFDDGHMNTSYRYDISLSKISQWI